jgi:hypothetical protein
LEESAKGKREAAAYISDMLLELRGLSQKAQLRHLTYFLEMAFYEAFQTANEKPPQEKDFKRS